MNSVFAGCIIRGLEERTIRWYFDFEIKSSTSFRVQEERGEKGSNIYVKD